MGGLTDVRVHFPFGDARRKDFRVIEDRVGDSEKAHDDALDPAEYLQTGAERTKCWTH